MTSLKYASGVISLSLSYEIETLSQRQERESTKRNKKLFLDLLEKSRGMITLTCERAEISRATYYVWVKNDHAFEEAVKEVTNEKILILEDRMFGSAMQGDFKALKYLLDRLHPEFKKKPEEKKESTVHIFHHVNGKKDEVKEMSAEDLFDQIEWVDNNLIYGDDGKPLPQNNIDVLGGK